MKKNRDGHKMLYVMAPLKEESGVITIECLLWQKYLFKLSRKDKRRTAREFKQVVKKIMEMEKWSTIGLRTAAEIGHQIDEIIKLPRSQELLKIIPRWKEIPIPNLLKFLLYPNLAGTICLDCLKRDGVIIYLVTDHETGEVICPNTGEVVRREPYQIIRPSRERPSPFRPPC